MACDRQPTLDELIQENLEARRKAARSIERSLPRHLLPASPTRSVWEVSLDDAMAGNFDTQPLEDTNHHLLQRLDDMRVEYRSARGYRLVVNCLTKAILERFETKGGHDVPGLTVEDMSRARVLARDMVRLCGPIQTTKLPTLYKLPEVPDIDPRDKVRRLRSENSSRPRRKDYSDLTAFRVASNVYDAESWEILVNEMENNWGCWVFEIIPMYLRQPLSPTSGEAEIVLFSNLDDFDPKGRIHTDYHLPPDWNSKFTYKLWILSVLSKGDVNKARKYMTSAVKGRLLDAVNKDQPWLIEKDLTRATDMLATKMARDNA